MINPLDLTGKHIVVTGASSGIGRATCIQASKLGAKISLIARNEDKLNDTLSEMDGTGHTIWKYDLNDVNGIENLIAQIAEHDGAFDGLVHCAGLGTNRPLKLTKPDFVSSMMNLHYFAFVELLRCASAKKRTNAGASYLGISSISAVRGDKTQGAYAAAKGAISSVVHPFAKELAEKGIRVNTVTFGMVETDMYKGFREAGGNNEELLQNQFLGIIPVEYAANIICFMLSDMSKYMTGGTLYYDAGTLS